jgi:hypothetical protein
VERILKINSTLGQQKLYNKNSQHPVPAQSQVTFERDVTGPGPSRGECDTLGVRH